MKKQIPLAVLKAIEPFVDKRGTNYESIERASFLMKFTDLDDESNFYFNIEEFKIDRTPQLLVDWKPANRNTIANHRQWIGIEILENRFSNWVKLLEEYEKVKTVFDDPILEAYAEEYFTEFEIIDEGADVEPFSTKHVLILDKHLTHIQKRIEKHQTNKNKIAIQEIKADAAELQKNLTKKSKKWVIKKLTRIWAKITKEGPRLMKEFLSESKKQILQEGVSLLMKNVVEIIN